jgi:4-alpha-glucanotransferase
MPIGLIADLAVGTDGGGSHAWSRQAEILPDVTVGAPPDIFSLLGQDWGLTAFSPLAMRAAGFGAFRELLTANMRHAGGLRVDHVMGLQRLWVVPKGAGPADGAYLRYPVDDLLRLLAIESHRRRAVIVGEDLGTLPEGFHDRMQRAGILGMRVLWFEQEKDGSFRPPARWSPDAAAMTTTHDLPTVIGWWRGRDVELRESLSLFPSAERADEERRRRERDREALWSAFRESGAADRKVPPTQDEADPVLDAALAHTGSAACRLAILPLEDVLGLPEQPNLPGTVDEHPNWRRRLPGEAGTLLDDPRVSHRLEALARARPRGDDT